MELTALQQGMIIIGMTTTFIIGTFAGGLLLVTVAEFIARNLRHINGRLCRDALCGYGCEVRRITARNAWIKESVDGP